MFLALSFMWMIILVLPRMRWLLELGTVKVEADTWLLLYSSLLFLMMKPLLWKASKQT